MPSGMRRATRLVCPVPPPDAGIARTASEQYSPSRKTSEDSDCASVTHAKANIRFSLGRKHGNIALTNPTLFPSVEVPFRKPD
jgi:hypothetical protein